MKVPRLYAEVEGREPSLQDNSLSLPWTGSSPSMKTGPSDESTPSVRVNHNAGQD